MKTLFLLISRSELSSWIGSPGSDLSSVLSTVSVLESYVSTEHLYCRVFGFVPSKSLPFGPSSSYPRPVLINLFNSLTVSCLLCDLLS